MILSNPKTCHHHSILVLHIDCFYQLKEYHFARLDYEQSLELSPRDWSVQTRLAMVHCDLGLKEYQRRKNTDALTHFDRAIQNNPKVSRFYICRATVKHVLEVGWEKKHCYTYIV